MRERRIVNLSGFSADLFISELVFKGFISSSVVLSVLNGTHYPNERGISILELLVALAIGFILMTVAVVNYPEFKDSFDRSNSFKILEFDLRRAKARAVAEGARGVIEFSGGTYTFGLDYLPYNSPPAPDVIEFLRNLPSSVTIDAAAVIFDSRGYLINEDGQLITRDIQLRQRGNIFMTLRVFPTGAIIQLQGN